MNTDTASNDRRSLLVEVSDYLLQTAVYTPIMFICLASITFFFTATMLVRPNGVIAPYVFLTLTSWAIVHGQSEALDLFDGEEREDSKITEVVMLVGTILYFNFMMGLTVFVALVAQQVATASLATALALVVPAADFYFSIHYGVGFAAVIATGFYKLGEGLTRASEKAPVLALRFLSGLESLLRSLEDAVPPAVAELSLSRFTRRRRLQ